MDIFNSNLDNIHLDVILEIGVYIDTFSWTIEQVPPFLIKYVKSKGLLTDEIYVQYVDVLSKTKFDNGAYNMIHIINFLAATDFVLVNNKCLCVYLSVLFPEYNKDIKKIDNIICSKIPSELKMSPQFLYLYVFEVLNYFECGLSENRVIGSISKSYLRATALEINKELTKLKDDAKCRYKSLLDSLNTAHDSKGDIETREKNSKEWRLIAKLYADDKYEGSKLLQGVSPDNYWTKPPFTRNTSATWEFYKGDHEKYLKLRLEIVKIFGINSNDSLSESQHIGNYTWEFNVKKSLWEKLNYSGEPSLEICVKMEISISEEDCVVSNVKWKCSKIWPSSNSGYVYGDSDPLGSTNYIP